MHLTRRIDPGRASRRSKLDLIGLATQWNLVPIAEDDSQSLSRLLKKLFDIYNEAHPESHIRFGPPADR